MAGICTRRREVSLKVLNMRRLGLVWLLVVAGARTLVNKA